MKTSDSVMLVGCGCFDSLRPSQQVCIHVGMRSCFPGLNQYQAAGKVSCSRSEHSDYASHESRTSNTSIPSHPINQLLRARRN